MKIKLVLSALLMAILSNSCVKDDADDTNNTSGKLYLRSLYSIVTGIVSIDWYYLGDNGVFVKNPKNGVQPINIEAEKANNLQNTGTYTIYEENGNSYIKITWTGNSTTTMQLKYKNGDIVEMDIMGTMMRQTGLPKGYTLNGKFKGYSTDLSFDFANDGSFVLKDYDYNTQKWETLTGNYTITGNNLKLKVNGGTVLDALLAEIDVNTLIINREYYERQ